MKVYGWIENNYRNGVGQYVVIMIKFVMIMMIRTSLESVHGLCQHVNVMI